MSSIIELLDSCGSDNSIANTARVSLEINGEWDNLPVGYTEVKRNGLLHYLVNHHHTSPFRHTSISLRVNAPLFVTRQLEKHQIGLCLHEDTEVTVLKQNKGTSNGKKTYRLGDLFAMWNGQIKYQGGKKGKRNVSGHPMRVFNEQTQRFEVSNITDVIDSGIKDVFTLTDEFGNTVTASKNHKFLTSVGWKRLKDLHINDYLIRDDEGLPFGHTEPLNRNPDMVTRIHHRRDTDKRCCECGTYSSEFEVDHIIPVKDNPFLATDPENVQTLCIPCHKAKSARERESFTTLLPKYSRVVSIEYAGKAQCYDLSIARIHNFMANGFVVHNSRNEISRRYTISDITFYHPKEWRVKPSKNIKQGSGAPHPNSKEWAHKYSDHLSQTLILYNAMIADDVAPEMARMVLPQSMMTQFIWTGSLLAFAHVYNLRSHTDTQKESQEYAQALDKVIAPLFPVSWPLLTKQPLTK